MLNFIQFVEFEDIFDLWNVDFGEFVLVIVNINVVIVDGWCVGQVVMEVVDGLGLIQSS